MAEVLVVASKIKEMVKKAGCNTAGDFAEALSANVEWMVKKAIERAKANGRKTVQAKDA
jgi:histone H3/H4